MWLGLGGVMVSLPAPGDPQDELDGRARARAPRAPRRDARDPSDRAERMALEAELAVLRAALAAVEAEPGEELVRAGRRSSRPSAQDLQRRLTEAEAGARRGAGGRACAAPPPAGSAPVLDAIGEELAALRAGLERERERARGGRGAGARRPRRARGQSPRAGEAYVALEALRSELVGAVPRHVLVARPELARAAAPPEDQTAVLDPRRLDAARSRLRTVPVDDTPASDWLARRPALAVCRATPRPPAGSRSPCCPRRRSGRPGPLRPRAGRRRDAARRRPRRPAAGRRAGR